MNHYQQVKEWFKSEDVNRLRGLNTEYGYLLYAHYMLEQMQAPENAKVLEI